MSTSVLIIDPFPIVRAGLVEAMAVCADLRPHDLADPLEAVERLSDIKPDVAVLDLSLKTVSGQDLISDIRTRAPRTKVLVFSSFDERVFARRVFRAGAAGFISKTAPVQDVIQAVRDVARGGLSYGDTVLQNGQSSGGKEPGDVLSNRELDVFLLLGRGHSPQHISNSLCIAMKTVYKHMANVKKKLSLPSGSSLTHHATVWVMETAEGRKAG
jgi:DNA-binding NarL/FixJ family response regulator